MQSSSLACLRCPATPAHRCWCAWLSDPSRRAHTPALEANAHHSCIRRTRTTPADRSGGASTATVPRAGASAPPAVVVKVTARTLGELLLYLSCVARAQLTFRCVGIYSAPRRERGLIELAPREVGPLEDECVGLCSFQHFCLPVHCRWGGRGTGRCWVAWGGREGFGWFNQAKPCRFLVGPTARPVGVMIQYQDQSPWVLQFPSCIIAIQIPARTQELLPFAIGSGGVAWLVWMPNSVPDSGPDCLVRAATRARHSRPPLRFWDCSGVQSGVTQIPGSFCNSPWVYSAVPALYAVGVFRGRKFDLSWSCFTRFIPHFHSDLYTPR